MIRMNYLEFYMHINHLEWWLIYDLAKYACSQAQTDIVEFKFLNLNIKNWNNLRVSITLVFD